LLETQTVIS